MVVLIEEIGEKGLVVDRELTQDALVSMLGGEGARAGFRPLAPAHLHARLDKVNRGVLLNARTELKLAGLCKRCLAETERTVQVDFMLNLVEQLAAPKDEDEEDDAGKHDLEGTSASFDLQSADEEPFDGRRIELGRLVGEQVMLALPMNVVCKESCKGLCPMCGKDLNEGECGCERTQIDPRLVALKDFKLS